MPIPIMAKFIGLIIVGMLIFSPTPPVQPINQKNNLENAQTIADRYGKPVSVWMNEKGQVNIQLASDKPIPPYTILHSTWVPRKK
jgi:hypothetical protein